MKLIKWLSVSDRYAKAYLDEKLAPLGLTSSQHMYVLKICRTAGLTQEALLDRLYIHPSNVTRTITLLERSGFLTRQPCDHDRRTYRLYPTEKAQKAVPAIEKACRDTEDALLKALARRGPGGPCPHAAADGAPQWRRCAGCRNRRMNLMCEKNPLGTQPISKLAAKILRCPASPPPWSGPCITLWTRFLSARGSGIWAMPPPTSATRFPPSAWPSPSCWGIGAALHGFRCAWGKGTKSAPPTLPGTAWC